MPIDDRQHTAGVEDPFSAGRSRHPFYVSASLAQRLDLLQHLVDYSHQPILVLGEAGAGKTRMLDELMQRAEENWRVAVVDASYSNTGTALMSVLAAAYGVLIEGADESEQFAALEAQLQAYARAMLIPVLLLDNAQLLADPAFGRLLDLMQAGEVDDNGLRVVMFCEPAAGAHINSLVLARHAQGITHSIDIPALSDDQIDEYLALYLDQVDGGEGIHFDDDEFDLIRRESAGLPGKINHIASGLLAGESSVEDLDSVPAGVMGPWLRDSGRGRYLLLGAVLLGIFITALWQWLAPDEEGAGAGLDEIALTLPRARDGAGEALVRLPEVAPDPGAAVPAPRTDGLEGARPTGTSTITEAPAAVATVTPEPPAEIPVAGSGGHAQSLPAPAQTESRPRNGQPESASQGSPGPAAPASASAGSAVPAAAPRPATVEKTPSSVPVVPPPRTTAKKNEPASGSSHATGSKPTPAPTRSGAGASGEAWLASLPRGAYVIQLFGSYDRAGALAFMRKYRKLGDLALLRTRHKRRDWYVVVHGKYAGRQQALRAVRHLPGSLRRLKPWAREAGALLEAVRLAN